MKSRLRSLLLSLFLFPLALQASTTAPMYAGVPGTALTIHGETFAWTSPATEDGTLHTDTYTCTDSSTSATYTVTVQGLISNPSLAKVTGSDATGVVNGYLNGGTYGDCLNSSESDGSWTIFGVNYTHQVTQNSYSVDLYGWELNNIYDHQYSGPDGTIHLWGNTEYYESHWYSVGYNAPPSSGMDSINAFGTTYTYSAPLSYRSQDESSDETVITTNYWTDTYTSASGTLQISNRNRNYPASTTYTVQVWNQDFGTVTSNPVATLPNSSLTGITWSTRTAPTFARAQLWLDGKLLNWQSCAITTAGQFTDTYSGAGVTLTVSASALAYFIDGSSAAVSITSSGGGSGTLAHDGSFSLEGHVLQNAEANHSAPLFTGAATVVNVSFANHAFTGGFEDIQGNRTDVYVNPSSGTLTLSGVSTNPNYASVKIYKNSASYQGTYNNGTFSVSGLFVNIPSSQPSIYGPPAFWVRGELYLQDTTTPNPTSYASAAGHSLVLSGTSAWTLAGADAAGAFSGACSHDPVGIFLVQALDESSQPIADSFVPVLPANADGTLHLSWEAAPTGMPPAGMDKNMHKLVYAGTAADDTAPASTAAYYASATVSDQTPWLLKIRTDGSTTTPYTATFTDYSMAATSIGSYSAQTHLFQTSAPAVPPATGFPVPVYGVDPNANFSLWELTQPEGGLPETFMVRGQPWRLSGYDPSNDTATYQGFYTGQQMALGAADASGERLVTLTDPIYNQGSQTATQGSLNSERRSALLRDGTLVLSGTDQGQQAVVQHEDDYKLQTIAADLDIVGNNLSFGILNGDASRAGALFNFADDSATASLHSILSRPMAQWAWWKALGTDSDSLRQVMRLDTDHRLNLYQAGDYITPAIVLDPAGTSSFRGPVRVPQSGDIPMGIYQEGDPP